MRRIHRTRGQSLAEYAVLFAIVLGAAIAMQQYIGTRLKGSMAFWANGYLNAQTVDVRGTKPNVFEPNRTATSSSTTNLAMTTVRAGNVRIGSSSITNVTKGTD